jgi:hypothetical protein
MRRLPFYGRTTPQDFPCTGSLPVIPVTQIPSVSGCQLKRLFILCKIFDKGLFPGETHFLKEIIMNQTSNAIETFLDYQKMSSKKTPFEIIFIS